MGRVAKEMRRNENDFSLCFVGSNRSFEKSLQNLSVSVLSQSETADTFWTIADAVVKHTQTTADESDELTKNFAVKTQVAVDATKTKR